MGSRRSGGSVPVLQGAKLFTGLRFHFVGFDRPEECKLVDGVEGLGGTNVRDYSPDCTHVVVSSDYTYDDPICAAARKDGKALVVEDWLQDCVEHRALLDTTSVLYTPVRNRSGIPGANLLCICLTGYQGVVRREVEKMVKMMGAEFSKPLVLSKVTHLICYKFEGDKHKFAKQHGVKTVNHLWLEACLKSWALVDEKDYTMSGEEAEAREIDDSQPEPQVELLTEANGKTAADVDIKQEKPDEPHPDKEGEEPEAQNQERALAVKQEAAEQPGKNAEADEKSVDSEATTQRYEQADDGDNCTSAAKALPDEVGAVSTSVKVNQVTPETKRSTPSSTSSKKRKSSPESQKVRVSENGDEQQTSRAKVKRGKLSRSRASRSSTKSGGRKDSNHEAQPMDVDKAPPASPQGEGNSRRLDKAANGEDSPKSPEAVVDVDAAEGLGDVKPVIDDKQNGGKAAESPIEIEDERTSEVNESKATRTHSKGKHKTERPEKMQMHKSKEKKHYFALSGHTQEKKKYTMSIRRLGGHVCRDDHTWKDQTTHCVMNSLRRTEKFFAALASGKWILKFEYLEASERAGMFVDEEKYEWFGTELIDEGRIDLRAPRRWRLTKQETGCGAFEDMRIIIYGECILPPLHTLKRAIKAGGGTVVATSPPFGEHLISGVDFAIIAFGIPQDDPHVVEMLRHKVACVRDEYFVDYICKPSGSSQKHILFNTGRAVEKTLSRLEKLKLTRSRMLARAAKRPSVASDDDKEDPACSVCHNRDKEDLMLLCDGCDKGTHTFCCNPPLSRVPEEDWYCNNCKVSRRK